MKLSPRITKFGMQSLLRLSQFTNYNRDPDWPRGQQDPHDEPEGSSRIDHNYHSNNNNNYYYYNHHHNNNNNNNNNINLWASRDLWASRESITDEFLFLTNLDMFIMRRYRKSPSQLDWSSDGCTVAHDNPFGFPFEPACFRHDFGYRNYKAQSRLDSFGRWQIDLRFKDDLHTQCDRISALDSCVALADTYYYAVRVFGVFIKRAEPALSSTPQPPAAQEETPEQIYNSYMTAIQRYKDAVIQDQAKGLLPLL